MLNKGEFYLMASRERVRVPTNQAAELMPFAATPSCATLP